MRVPLILRPWWLPTTPPVSLTTWRHLEIGGPRLSQHSPNTTREKRDIKWSHWDTNSYKELHKTQQCTQNFLLWFLFLEMENCQTIHHNSLSLPLCQDVDISEDNHLKQKYRLRHWSIIKNTDRNIILKLKLWYCCALPEHELSVVCYIAALITFHLPLCSFTNIRGRLIFGGMSLWLVLSPPNLALAWCLTNYSHRAHEPIRCIPLIANILYTK